MTGAEGTQLRTTVVLVDDHAVVRQGVRTFLATQPDLQVVGEAGSGEEGVRLCRELAPCVALVDLLMPGLDGVETTRRIKQASPDTHVIILTSYHDDEHILPAMRAGARSYLLKDVSPDELAQAVRRAAAGGSVLHPTVASRVVQLLQAPEPSAPGPAADLSEREVEVLRLIADGLTNADISRQLFISEKTVKTHVSNILAKLEVEDRTQAAVFAWREGIMQRG